MHTQLALYYYIALYYYTYIITYTACIIIVSDVHIWMQFFETDMFNGWIGRKLFNI